MKCRNASYSYASNGNLTTDGSHSYVYDARNRLVSVDYAVHYTHNGLGQRIKKEIGTPQGPAPGDANGDGIYTPLDGNAILDQILQIGTAPGDPDCNQDGQVNVQDLVCVNIRIANGLVPAANEVEYFYDEQGQLIGEYNASGTAIEETVYLGSQPVAVLKQGDVYYIHSDPLNTPRVITDSTGTVIWRWDSDPFGATAANEDPDLDGIAFTYNLRFPGQYYDQETGLHYNYFRYYDPGTGRYLTSDPIGVLGMLSGKAYTLSKDLTQIPLLETLGQSRIPNELLAFTRSLNVYAYVENNPLRWIDPLGLDRYDICRDFGPLGEAACKGCVGAVCGIPGVARICCKVDFDDCIGESGGDTAKMQECAAKFNACTLKKPKKLPNKPNSGCSDDGGCI